MARRDVELVIRARQQASAAIEQVNTALDELRKGQREIIGTSDQFGRSVSRSFQQAGSGAAGIGQRFKAAGDKIEGAQKAIRESVDRAEKSLNEQQQELAQTEARYRAIRDQVNGAKAALDSFRRSGQAARGATDQLDLDARQARGAGGLGREPLRSDVDQKQIERTLKSLQRELDRTDRQLSEQREAVRTTSDEYNRLARTAAVADSALGDADGIQRQREDLAKLSRAFNEAREASRRQRAERQAAREANDRATAALRRTFRGQTEFRQSLRATVQALRGGRRQVRGWSEDIRRATSAQGRFRLVMQQFTGDGRRALNLIQRLRGEVLSLTASYVGFFALFQTSRGFFEAFSTLQAAQNRFAAAFEGNTARVSAEIAFLTKEANRLGIEFGVLSENFSKFLISGQQAGLEAQELRTIFTQVTEAARVLRLSNEQINGVLTALSQIAGKGTLQMEELRQQLGDRLPGAVGLLAEELGFAEDELDQFYDQVEAGNIRAEESLIALGSALEKNFSGALPRALESVSAEVGRLQDTLFQRRLDAAQSGFINGLQVAIDALNEFLNSEDGIEFFRSLGAAFGRAASSITVFLDNFDLVLKSIQTLVAIKSGQIAGAFVASIAQMIGGTRRFRVILRATRIELAATSTWFRRAGGAARVAAAGIGVLNAAAFGARAAVKALFASIGGLVGLAASFGSFFLINQLTEVEDSAVSATSALQDHADTLGKVQAAYLATKNSMEDFRSELEEGTEASVRANIEALERARRDLSGGFSGDTEDGLLGFIQGDTQLNNLEKLTAATLEAEGRLTEVQQRARDSFREVSRQFRAGEVSSEDFLASLDRVSGAFDDDLFTDAFGSGISSRISELRELETALAEARAQLRLIEGEATQADLELLGVEGISDTAGAFEKAAEASSRFNEALSDLRSNISDQSEEEDLKAKVDEIESSYQNVLRTIRQIPNATARAAAAQDAFIAKSEALTDLFEGTLSDFKGGNLVTVTEELLKEFESFQPTAKFDVNAFRLGFGSDTKTLADGTFVEVAEGMRVTVEQALRDLRRRLTTEFIPQAQKKVGPDAFAKLNTQQQAAIVSLIYNFGAGNFPDSVASAVQGFASGNVSEDAVAATIRDAGSNPNLQTRRNKEAALFASDIGQEQAIEAAEERLAAEEEISSEIDARLDKARFEAAVADEGIIKQAQAKALREARLKAQEEGVELSQAEIEKIKEAVRLEKQEEAQQEAINRKKEEAAELEERVNLLQQRRASLVDQRDAAAESGDLAAAERIGSEINSVEQELRAAVNEAIRFWEAFGGEGSEQAILRLKDVQREINRTTDEAATTGRQINELIGQSLTNAFSSFAQAIGEGKSVVESFFGALQQAISDTLIRIGELIIEAAVMNALFGDSINGQGGIGGVVSSFINSIVAHEGAVVGEGNAPSRAVPVAAFANAIRYHDGGGPGLRSNEVAAVLERGEEVLPADDPRHRNNQGGSAAANVKVVNAVDGTDALDQALATPEGQQVIMNFMRRNRDAVKGALG